MDLSTTYLGLRLAHPYMVGASPLAGTLDAVKRLEDAGSSAIVLHSLFEEQITLSSRGEIRHRDPADPRFAAALAHFPALDKYALSVDGYLELIRLAKSAVAVPIVASLNGTTREAWMRTALDIEQAGAHALEVNLYEVVSDPRRSAMSVETELRNVVLELKRVLHIPVAMKLSPYFTALGNVAERLDHAGVDGLILFNRFYQPDVDVDSLTLRTHPDLSTPVELRLRLQWAALLHRRVKASLAVTGGVSTWEDGVKAILAGADAVQMVSAVLRNGLEQLGVMREGLERYLESHGFESVAAIKGRASLAASDDPAAFQRAAYIRTLHGLRKAAGG
ncbi:MAG: dihydroorotate dehydrogenase-like protein [Vicinamibacterales bacterium]